MRVARFPLVVAVLLIARWMARAADNDSLPRYRFEPGQTLTFHASLHAKQERGAHETEWDWTVWLVRKNAGGSFRLVVREKMKFVQTFAATNFLPLSDTQSDTKTFYADVFPDGRIVMNKTIQTLGGLRHPRSLFPRLPRDTAETMRGWTSRNGDDETISRPLSSAGSFAFEATMESPMHKILLATSKAKYTFDPAKGFVTLADIASTQGYGFKGRGTGKMELRSVAMMKPDALQEFATASDRYFAAAASYEDSGRAALKATPERAKALLAKAVADLKAAAERIKNEDLRAALAKTVKDHDELAKDYLESVETRARIVGKPATEFDTTTIDGKKVKLTNLRGQVVVLDFWYRGCGWCVKAMPQINQLADDFAGKPVMIFGMNTDRNDEDAKFVIEKMALKYGTLKAEGLPDKFGVQGFPTLIIIDQRGKVHDIHVGYSPDLREEVSKQIRALLTNN